MPRRPLSDLYRAAVMRATRVTFPFWERLGVHVTPVHYHSPVPDTRSFPAGLWTKRLSATGVDLRESEQVELLEDFRSRFADEIDAIPLEPTADPTQYYVRNNAFESVDGEILYCMVRYLRPRRVIEIGSGFSTLITAQALRRNAAESGAAADFTAIEPYPNAVIRAGVPGLTRLLSAQVQEVPIDTFRALDRDDILFIDSSHVVASGSDVVYEFLEILPQLRPGVIVHVHDIFLPVEYKREWLMSLRMFWNEQYILQAMLANNPTWEVLWGGSYMHLAHPDRLTRAFRSYDPRTVWPASFWVRKTR